MTQPVQEPTQDREIQGLGYRTRQLARRPGPPQAGSAQTEQGWGSMFNLPVLERHMETNNNNASGAVTYAIDNTYPHNGYIAQASNNNWIEWVVQLGPQGSSWLPIVMFGMGPDFGKVTLQIASAPYVDDALSVVGSGGIESSGAPVTFVDVQTFDCYTAVHDPFPAIPQVFKPIEVTGADGVIGTTIGAGNPLNWDGGSGAHFLRLKTDGQNASSSGFKKRISAFIMERVSIDGYA